jgi:uncharacterized protein (TIGR02147 family)
MKERPEIFQYHDHLIFLRDWLAYRKASQPGFSLRNLAKQAGLASGYLPMILSGKRSLSGAAVAKIVPFLDLSANELSFFENLVVLGTSDSHDARITALDRMKRFGKFQKHNARDAEAYRYLTRWYYVAIREMSALPGFQADPEWILKQLRFAVPLKEIKDALEFLIRNKYIEFNADGSIRPPEKSIDCSGGIYRVALTQFHREVFHLASLSIETVPNEERNIQGYTCSLTSEQIDQAKEIVEEAMEKIRKLGQADKKGETVYHMEMALFPLTGSAQRSTKK